MDNRGKDRLSDQDLASLETVVRECDEKPFRAKQIATWMFQKGVFDPTAMTNLSVPLRSRLAERFPQKGLEVEAVSSAADGTDKLLFTLADGQKVESVMIPAEERTTICLSSQVGCAVRCRFCASGIDGGKRNLSRGEIIEQFLVMKNHTEKLGRRVTNLVMMGMGEPMFNYANVFGALDVIHSPDGANLGARRITVSTVGIRSGVERFTQAKTQYTLAFSLHAPNDQIRAEVVPLRAAMTVEEIRDAATKYLDETGREVTFEYVLLDAVNCAPEHAKELIARFRGVRGTFNLIPYNPVQGLPYRRPADPVIDRFVASLESAGLKVKIRRRRGNDIAAACGQLALKAARQA